jgi:HEAT repeat protein
MRKLLIVLLFITFVSCVIITYDIIPTAFWSCVEFTKPTYFKELRIEWAQKPSDFLLRKLYSINVMRFSIAANILAKRGDQRAINVLVKKARSNYIDINIHFSACSALSQISPGIAKSVLEEIVEKYRKSTWHKMPNHDSATYQRYKNALNILTTMKDESIYPICLQMAKSGDRLEKQSSLNAMLYHFDNHAEEILPLYLDYLNVRTSPKGQIIKAIKNLKRPEAILVLEEFALKNKDYAKDAREAIEYLKSLQK